MKNKAIYITTGVIILIASFVISLVSGLIENLEQKDNQLLIKYETSEYVYLDINRILIIKTDDSYIAIKMLRYDESYSKIKWWHNNTSKINLNDKNIETGFRKMGKTMDNKKRFVEKIKNINIIWHPPNLFYFSTDYGLMLVDEVDVKKVVMDNSSNFTYSVRKGLF